MKPLKHLIQNLSKAQMSQRAPKKVCGYKHLKVHLESIQGSISGKALMEILLLEGFGVYLTSHCFGYFCFIPFCVFKLYCPILMGPLLFLSFDCFAEALMNILGVILITTMILIQSGASTLRQVLLPHACSFYVYETNMFIKPAMLRLLNIYFTTYTEYCDLCKL